VEAAHAWVVNLGSLGSPSPHDFTVNLRHALAYSLAGGFLNFLSGCRFNSELSTLSSVVWTGVHV